MCSCSLQGAGAGPGVNVRSACNSNRLKRRERNSRTETMHLRRSEGDNTGVARLGGKRQSLTDAVPGKRTDRLPVRLTSQDQSIVIDAHKLHRAIGISDRDDRLTWVTRNRGYARVGACQDFWLPPHWAVLAVKRPEDELLGTRCRQEFSICSPAQRAHARRITGHPHVFGISHTPPMQRRLLHGGDQKLSIRADGHAEMRALPLQEFRLGAACVRKPQRDASVVSNRQAESFWCECETGDRRRRVERPKLALPRANVGRFARRPGNRVIWPQRDVINPSFFFFPCQLAMCSVGRRLDQLAVVPSGNNAFSIGYTVENCTGVNDDAPFAVVAREKQRFLAEHKDSHRSEKMHADDRSAGVEPAHTICYRRHIDLIGGHPVRISSSSTRPLVNFADC